MFDNMVHAPKSFEDALAAMAEHEESGVSMGSRNQRSLVLQETQAGNELLKLRDFFKLNAEIARKAADKTRNEIGHGVHTGEACAFEAAAGYVALALGRLGY